MVKKKKGAGENGESQPEGSASANGSPEKAEKLEKAEKPAAAATTNGPGAVGMPADMGLVVGDYVEIHSLQGAKELNGRRGRIIKFVPETGRFGVKLEGAAAGDDAKAIKPVNLTRLEGGPFEGSAGAGEKAQLEKQLADVMQQLKENVEGEERLRLQKELQSLVLKIKTLNDKQEAELAKIKAAAAKAAAMPPPAPPAPKPTAVPAPAPAPAPKPTPKAAPLVLQPPPPPKEQHHPLPPKQKEMPVREVFQPRPIKPTPVSRFQPPILPERPSAAAVAAAREPVDFMDEHEYPDPTLAIQAMKAVAGASVVGIIASLADLCPATWFVWSFLAVHLVGVIFLTDYAQERGLIALCATFGLHMGVAVSEAMLWMLGRDGTDSLGPWSFLMFFASMLYLHSFWSENMALPPDYITSISMFFPMFPAFNGAVAMSCLEMFLEWRYFPELKMWSPLIFLGVALMAFGQYLIYSACQTGERNFWASCRNMPEEEEKPEDFVGLEIPNRRIVQEQTYRWERHPAYLGAMLWGVGAELTLCNPGMLLIVGFVLWASLLHVTLEEEQELYDEFKGGYANYCALTRCWIPMFNSFLENAAFQREMLDNLEEQENNAELEEEEEEEEEEGADDDVLSEDDLLPTWEGVPKGGALWNRQFSVPWMLA
eukprot:TRINITY_DN19510_c0_g3_i1.p2 TRINITY_DN19510_c0_g3~~TRINITY_DN19510_c0_g3_i1.p2  ORF type:complete len:656 (-),score=195.32 TRINITY_DN19510_c0_g3_i1:150-2117(-)